MKLGVLCPANIARRRFLPALAKIQELEFVGLAKYSKVERFGVQTDISKVEQEKKVEEETKKALDILDKFPGKLYESYMEMLLDESIEAIYIPLPPALHYEWGKLALENGKHVIMEKPLAINLLQTKELIELASKNGLTIHENYMFLFHKQLEEIRQIIESGKIGEIRLYRLDFGFPMREQGDFRYNKELGGGGLLDAGGYCLRYAAQLLGKNAKVISAVTNNLSDSEIDLYGAGMLVNSKHQVVQMAYGMDNNYSCSIEVWGSTGTLASRRIFTAPDDYKPTVEIEKNGERENIVLQEDNSFVNSIKYFVDCVHNEQLRNQNYKNILQQAMLIEEFFECARKYQS